MTWNPHINKIASKLSCAIGIFRRMKRFLPLFILKTLYSSLFLSYVNYGILLWGSNMKRIVKLQKFAVRSITNSKYRAHTEPIFKRLSLLKVSDIHELNVLKFYYKYKNNVLPSFFRNMFEYAQPSHNYNTRHGDVQYVVPPSTTSAERSIRYIVPTIVSKTPPCIINKIDTHSINGFSQYIKKFMCDKYLDSCNIANCYICNLT